MKKQFSFAGVLFWVGLFTIANADACRLIEKRIAIQPESIGAKNAELPLLIEKIEFSIQDPDVYLHEFVGRFGSKPTPREIDLDYSLAIMSWNESITHLIEIVSKTHPEISNSIQTQLTDLMKRFRAQLKLAERAGNTGSALGRARVIFTRANGFSGELRGLISLKDITQYSKHLKDIPALNAAIDARMDRVYKHLKEHPEALVEYEKKYPEIFKSDAIQKESFATIGKRLAYIQRWIGTKEIDFVMVTNGFSRWVEFKYRDLGYEERDFNHEQLKQDLQILDFIGMRDSFSIEYIFAGPVSAELKRALNNLNVGVTVLN